MVFLILIPVGVFILGFLGYSFYKHEENVKQQALAKEQTEKQHAYELAILKEIQDRIGYELDIEKVIDVITGSLKNLFVYSTASSIVIKNDELIIKTFIEEPVNHSFVNQVKSTMLASLAYLSSRPLPQKQNESYTGMILDDTVLNPPASFFNIPLVINETIVGMITIASSKPGLYKEAEMTILYKITNQASLALTRLQQVLETEKGKLMAMIGSLRDGLFMVDTNNNLLVINDSAKIMLGLSGQETSIIHLLSALQGKYDLALKLREATTQKRTIEQKEVALANQIVRIFITPVIDAKTNAAIGAAVVLQDITAEKNLERAKEDFTSMMVHELRAPLTAIRGATQLMEGHLEDTNTFEQEKMLKVISEQTTRMLDDVNSLLDAAKMDAGKFTIQKEHADLKKIIEEKIAFFSPQAQAKHITLISHVPQNLPTTTADSFRIGQVFNNLISNSLKYTPENGHIQIGAMQDGQTIKITVADTGIGIPKEKQSKLFTRYTQVSGVRKTSGGTGLGLYITKGIVTAHGGTIMLDSDIGRGTRISFTLPIMQTTEQIQTGEQAPKPIMPASQLVN